MMNVSSYVNIKKVWFICVHRSCLKKLIDLPTSIKDGQR